VEIPVEAEDVRAERLRVEALPPGDSSAAIVIKDLRKTFPATWGGSEKKAVLGLTLAIERGECFGLLGPNGAGKSTTLNVLTGFLEPTEGTAVVEGHDIRHDMPAIYSLMGVAPQDNLLWERLTAREHLTFYGRLKNLAGSELGAAVERALEQVNLLRGGVGDRQVRTYSGGMKRRLSVAISFIGAPLVAYLDEPSTGLDPASRQNLWSVVREAKRDRAIILTTHSMEEATALCDRLGIFVDGSLACIGNPKELTARYGGYYVFTLTTPPSQEAAAHDLVLRMSPGARLTYALAGTRKYELPVTEVTLPGARRPPADQQAGTGAREGGGGGHGGMCQEALLGRSSATTAPMNRTQACLRRWSAPRAKWTCWTGALRMRRWRRCSSGLRAASARKAACDARCGRHPPPRLLTGCDAYIAFHSIVSHCRNVLPPVPTAIISAILYWNKERLDMNSTGRL
jgi:ABC-type multidrug transport system ATPase subunit